ncbi:MAG: hypothetical protein RJA22_3236 [Verrucomicrobiota bacterium]|jgi:hypothetical protein
MLTRVLAVLGRMAVVPAILRWLLGPRVWAVAALTWKAAFRFRLFWVLAALLLGSVVVLPLLIQDDGTARGFIQIMLTYTLSVITALLGFSTLWLACGILARDIEDCSIQTVAVKPVARWQIWLGKLVGLMLLNGVLLAVSGGSVYALLQWRTARMEAMAAEARAANNPRLADAIQAQVNILRNEIFVARAGVKEPPPDLEATVAAELQKVLRQQALPPDQVEATREQLRERVKAVNQVVPPNHYRTWSIDLGLQRHRLGDQPLFIRVKFHAAATNLTGTYMGLWSVGPYDNPKGLGPPQSLAANTYHEIQMNGGTRLLDEQGRLVVNFVNQNDTALIFPLEDGLEVLYREGGFALNFARGLGVIFCWLTLLAVLGLSAASLMSFPVAAFFSLSMLLVALSSGTLAGVVAEGSVGGLDHETGAGGGTLLDRVLVPVFGGVLKVVNLVEEFSPVDALSTGRSITWGQLARAFAQIVLLLGGVLAGAGLYCFSRRELATAGGHG